MSDDLKRKLEQIRAGQAEDLDIARKAAAEGHQTRQEHEAAIIAAEGFAARFSRNCIEPQNRTLLAALTPMVGTELRKQAIHHGAPGHEGFTAHYGRDDRGDRDEILMLAQYDADFIHLRIEATCSSDRENPVFKIDKTYPVSSFDDKKGGEPHEWLVKNSKLAAEQIQRRSVRSAEYGRSNIIHL